MVLGLVGNMGMTPDISQETSINLNGESVRFIGCVPVQRCKWNVKMNKNRQTAMSQHIIMFIVVTIVRTIINTIGRLLLSLFHCSLLTGILSNRREFSFGG